MNRIQILLSLLTVAVYAPVWSQEDAQQEEEVFELSPFEVRSEDNSGYYAANTLAGTRLNTSIADLGASITVVTLEQMEDTASVDINDIFQYEANTEGANTYTESVAVMRGDGLLDTNAGGADGRSALNQGHTTANRIRGIGRPGTTLNYYQSLPTVPFDAYNTSSVEIARGPNSLLFGMGNPAGIVNQSAQTAQFGEDSFRIQLRTDDMGSLRASARFNITPIEDKVALFGAFLKDDRNFRRKPSYDDTKRAYGAITLKPFKRTTIRASLESFKNENRRPNSITPRDAVTPWIAGGRWTYNPVTGIMASLDTGEQRGPVSQVNSGPRIEETRSWIESQTGFDPALWNSNRTKYNGVNIYGSGAFIDPSSILYTPGIALGGHEGTGGNSRPLYRIVNGGIHDYIYWRGLGQGRYRVGFGTETDPAGNAPKVTTVEELYDNPVAWTAYDTVWTNSHFDLRPETGVADYIYPGVTDKSIYNWEKVNALQMNWAEKDNVTYNLEFEQRLLDDLVLSAGYFRQEYEEWTSYTVSQLNTATIAVDTNTHRPDGSPNELFGLPFLRGPSAPDNFQKEKENETMRAMIAWTPDFTRNDGWTQWLGRHQAIGLVSKYSTMDSFWRKRWYIIDSDEAVNSINLFEKNPLSTAYNKENRSVQRYWYLGQPGDPQDGTVSRSSGAWSHRSYEGQMEYFNYTNNAWQTQRYNTEFIDHNAHTGRSQREVDSLSFGITSFLWNERLVTTLGWRSDDYRARETTSGQIKDIEGNIIEPSLTTADKWDDDGYYVTDLVFDRWNRWDEISGETTTIGAVFRPFDNWKGIQNEFIRSFGFSYNKSENFNPPPAAQVDYFGNPLPKPTGTTEDWGIQFSLFDNKLFARCIWFTATNEFERSSGGSVASRVTKNVDEGQFRKWAERIVLINKGLEKGIAPTDQEFDFLTFGLSSDEIDELQDAAAEIWGLEYDYFNSLAGSVTGTRTLEATGWEVEVVYNPTSNWTIKFTGAKQESVYNEVLKEYDAWLDYRGSAWENARAAEYLTDPQYASYTTFGGREVNLTGFWNSYGYTSQVTGEDPMTPNQLAYFDEIITPQLRLERELQGQVTPGQRKYRATLLSNYKFTEGRLRGFNLGGSIRWEDKSIIGYYGKPNEGGSTGDLLVISDITRPIHDGANTRVDLWWGYEWKFDSGVIAKVRLNVVDAFENGRLQPIKVNLNGDVYGYRIIDPRRFILTLDLLF